MFKTAPILVGNSDIAPLQRNKINEEKQRDASSELESAAEQFVHCLRKENTHSERRRQYITIGERLRNKFGQKHAKDGQRKKPKNRTDFMVQKCWF